MWKGLSCELSVASSDHEKDWFHHLKDVKLEVSVAGQLDGKIIQTMMVSSAWTRMPGNISLCGPGCQEIGEHGSIRHARQVDTVQINAEKV